MLILNKVFLRPVNYKLMIQVKDALIYRHFRILMRFFEK